MEGLVKYMYYQTGIPENFKGYVVVNPQIQYDYTNFSKEEYLNNINIFYSDGNIVVGGAGNI